MYHVTSPELKTFLTKFQAMFILKQAGAKPIYEKLFIVA